MKAFLLFTRLLIIGFGALAPTLWASQMPLPKVMQWPNQTITSISSKKPVLGEPIHSEFIFIHYANMNTIRDFVTSNRRLLFSSRGGVSVLTKKHALWVHDDLKHRQHLKKLIQQLDTLPKQIRIAARIVSVDQQYLHSLGVDFNDNPPIKINGLNRNLPQGSSTDGVFYFTLARFSGRILDLQLSALEQQGHAKIISKPQLLTTNQKAAVIESGEEVPYQQKTASGATSVAFKKAVLKLSVTPQILPHQQVLLYIDVHQDKLTTLAVHGAPIIHTQQIRTEALVNNQQTLVLGGIIQSQNTQRTRGVALLSHIPFLGHLFKYQEYQHEKKELIIFITPQVITSNR